MTQTVVGAFPAPKPHRRQGDTRASVRVWAWTWADAGAHGCAPCPDLARRPCSRPRGSPDLGGLTATWHSPCHCPGSPGPSPAPLPCVHRGGSPALKVPWRQPRPRASPAAGALTARKARASAANKAPGVSHAAAEVAAGVRPHEASRRVHSACRGNTRVCVTRAWHSRCHGAPPGHSREAAPAPRPPPAPDPGLQAPGRPDQGAPRQPAEGLGARGDSGSRAHPSGLRDKTGTPSPWSGDSLRRRSPRLCNRLPARRAPGPPGVQAPRCLLLGNTPPASPRPRPGDQGSPRPSSLTSGGQAGTGLSPGAGNQAEDRTPRPPASPSRPARSPSSESRAPRTCTCAAHACALGTRSPVRGCGRVCARGPRPIQTQPQSLRARDRPS